MNNPFDIIDARLSNIENLLIDLKHSPKETIKLPDVGGIAVAMEITGLAKQTVYQLVSKNQIPFMKKGGKLYFSRAQLLEWINSGKRKTVDDLIGETNKLINKNSGRKG
jgi:excisionase family DNA binding protein